MHDLPEMLRRFLAPDAFGRKVHVHAWPRHVAAHWFERVEAFDLAWWRDPPDSVPQNRRSHPARNFAFEVVRHNREGLLDAHRSR